MSFRKSLPFVPVLLALTGCAVETTTPAANSIAATGMSGTIFGGQQPVVGSTVTVWAAGTTGYGTGATMLGTPVTSGAGGAFTYGTYTCPANNPPVYITAQGGNPGIAGGGTNTNIMLAAGIGLCSNAPSVTVNLNEVTTAATAFALSHFFTTTLGAGSTDAFGGTATASEGNNAGLVLANDATIPTLVNIPSGTVNSNTSTITIESAKIYTIANIIASCVNSAGQTSTSDTTSACGQLFSNTTPPGAATRPSDTLQAAVQIALYPYQHVAPLFALSPASSPFAGLATQPNDFTVGVAYTSSAFGLGIHNTPNAGGSTATSSNIDIDVKGRIWFPTNRDSSRGLGFFDPASQTFNGPYATALTRPQYLAIDNAGEVWATDSVAGQVVGVSTTSPTTTSMNAFATPSLNGMGTIAGPIGISSNASVSNALLYNVQSGSNSSLYSYVAGTQSVVSPYTYNATGIAPFTYRSAPGYFEAEASTSGVSSPCLIESAYTTGTGFQETDIITRSASPCVSGGIAQINQAAGESLSAATSLNLLCSYESTTCFTPPVPIAQPEGIAIDGDSNVWIANSGNASISTMLFHQTTQGSTSNYTQTSPVAYLHDSTHGNTIGTPYGIAIDRSGNVWVSNISCVTSSTTPCNPGSFFLSELIGAGAPTLTPLASQTPPVMQGTRPNELPAAVNAQYTAPHGRNR